MSDIHCDLPALERALQQMPPVDHILCAGDIMLQYRFSNDLCDMIREHNIIPVLGNHDAHILAPSGMMLRRSGSIRPDNLEYLDSLPTILEMDVNGKKLMMMHTSPYDPTGGGRGLENGIGVTPRYAQVELGDGGHVMQRVEQLSVHDQLQMVNGRRVTAEEAVRMLVDENQGNIHKTVTTDDLPERFTDILIVGHTHLPIITKVEDKLLINPGSLAQPRDPNNPDRRTYVILDTDTWDAEIHSFNEAIGAVYR